MECPISKQTPKTPNKEGQISPCSCDECDTIRCFTRRYPTYDYGNNDRCCSNCIFYTNVTVKKSNSYSDTARKEGTPLQAMYTKETECEICRKFFKDKNNFVTHTSASSLIDLINTKKSVCEKCIANMNKINNNVELAKNESTQLDTTRISKPELESKLQSEDFPKPKLQLDKTESKVTTKPDKIISKSKNNDIKKPELELRKSKQDTNNATTKSESEKCIHKNNVDTEEPASSEQTHIRKSKCKICIRDFNKKMGVTESELTPIERILKGSSTCKLGGDCLQSKKKTFAAGSKATPSGKVCVLTRCKACERNTETLVNAAENNTTANSRMSLPENFYTKSTCKFCQNDFVTDTVDNNIKPTEKINIGQLKPNIYRKVIEGLDIAYIEIPTVDSETQNKIISKITSLCQFCKKDINSRVDAVNNKMTPTEKICTKKSNCKIYRRNIEDWESAPGKISKTKKEISSTEKIKILSSPCPFCKRGVDTTDSVNSNFTSREKTCTSKSKCKGCKRDIEEREIAVSKKTSENREITPSEKRKTITSPCQLCKIDIEDSKFIPREKICTGKLRCKECKRDMEWEITNEKVKTITTPCQLCKRDIAMKGRLNAVNSKNISTEKICRKKSTCKFCRRDIEDWEVSPSNEITPTEIINTTTSACQICKRNIKMAHKLDAVNDKMTPKQVICPGKSKCKVCKRDIDEWENEKKITHDKINKIPSQCKLCRTNVEIKGNINADINETSPTQKKIVRKNCNKDIKMKNQKDIINDDVILMDKIHIRNSQCKVTNIFTGNCCPQNTVEVSKKTPIPSKKKFTCDCEKAPSNNQANLKMSAPVTKVNNANVTYFRKVPNSGAAKLTAQIMNVPYEELNETLNQQESNLTKDIMKGSLSKDIFKRIIDIYKACSCKVCECVAGKSITSDNGCNCKPCDCQDCKAFKKWHTVDHTFPEAKFSCHNKDCSQKICERVAKQIQNEPCDCLPCECIQCTQNLSKSCNCTPCNCYECKSVSLPLARNYVTARVADNHHSENCTCTPCRCLECERNFFSLSTHLTHEMSTGMSRSCRCEQCLDQRCIGAGGNDDCRCEGPSKAIFKPVEKDSHDYGIHRAAVCHPRNTRSYPHDTIAMYASISSNFPQLGTLQETCSCEECDCIVCKGENSKTSIKTILKPQLASLMQPTDANTCTCKPCQCEISTSSNRPGCNFYQETECKCDICDCISCPNMAKPSTAKMGLLANPIGKIYYRNNEKEQNDNRNAINEGSLGFRQNVCMKAMVNENCISSKDLESLLSLEYDAKQKNNGLQYWDSKKCLPDKTCSTLILQDLAEQLYNVLPQISSKTNFHKNINVESNYLKGTPKHNNWSVSQCNKYFQSDVNLKINTCPFQYTKPLNSEKSMYSFPSIKHKNCKDYHENKTMESNPPWLFSSSNYDPNSPKTTLETCETLESKLKMQNIDYNTHAYDTEKTLQSANFDHVEPFSNFHRILYSKKLSGAKIQEPVGTDIRYRCDIKKQSHICDTPSATNYNHTSKNLIDYDRVYNTLKEAKNFSGQLMKLLGKYERANKDFQSVSEKLKLLRKSHECSKLEDTAHLQLNYVIVKKQENIDNDSTLVNTMKEVNCGLNDIETSLCITNSTTNLDSTTKENNGLIFINNDQNKNWNQNKTLAQRERCQSNHKTIITTDNIEILKNDNRGESTDYHPNFKNEITPSTIKAKEILENDETHIEKKIAKNNVLQDVKIPIDPNEDKTKIICTNNNDKVLNTKDKTNIYQIKDIQEIMPNEFALEKNVLRPLSETTQNKIDILTNQLSEMIKDTVIKNCEETSRNIKYSSSIENFNNNDLKSQDKEKEKTKSMSSQTVCERHFIMNPKDRVISLKSISSIPRNKTTQVDKESDTRLDHTEKAISLKSGPSVPRNKTTQVDKESDTRVDFMVNENIYFLRNIHKDHHDKPSRSTMKSWNKPSGSTLRSSTEFDSDMQCKFTTLNSKRPSELDLLVDGRPVQKIIDSSRCMAVVTCLPNCEKVLLTMKTILAVPTQSEHQPCVTLIYYPRLKKNKN